MSLTPNNNPIREERGLRARAAQPVGAGPSRVAGAAPAPTHPTRGGNPLLPLVVGVVAAAVIGAVLAYVSYQYFSFVLLSVVIAAALLGVTVRAALRGARVRSQATAVGIGLLSTLVMLGVYAFADFGLFWQGTRTEIINEWNRRGLSMPDSAADEAIAEVLVEDTGRSDIIGYRMYSAQQGMDIERRGSTSTLSGQLLWGLWGIEALAALFVVGGMARAAVNDIFCDAQDRWLTWQRVGYVRGQHWDALKSAISVHDVQALGGALEARTGMNLRGWVRIEAGRCEADGPGWVRAIRESGRNSQTVLPPTYVEANLLDALGHAPAKAKV